ncbi:MAG: BlaI/MecI/CopY family transcriptional regulator [bacterium]|nr:BlaI/MecI/CopY family transcriptional regulator [bacterium]
MAKTKREDLLEHQLSRRERQIMSAIYRLGEASVADIVMNIPEPPTQDAVRRLCHILTSKGLLHSRPDKRRKIYSPTVTSQRARSKALSNLLDTFFGGSPRELVATLLDAKRDRLSAEEIERLSALVEREEGDLPS